MPTDHIPLELPQPSWPWNGRLHMDHYTHQYYHQPPSGYFSLPPLSVANHNCEREHLFEKLLTPSDVGKLNRLVIPKQHAEKYFPLDTGGGWEKGLLLCFEDESGKLWRFRYSYWTSSQSYVLTKGWSRFVKEKGLDAGDVVLFERWRKSGGGDVASRLFIGWKRRSSAAGGSQEHDDGSPAPAAGGTPAAPPWNSVFYPAAATAASSSSGSYMYVGSVQQPDSLVGAGEYACLVQNTTPAATTERIPTTAPAATNSKRLRLFGVNLDCGPNHQQQQQPEPPNQPNGWCLGRAHHTDHDHWLRFMPSSTGSNSSQ